MAGLFGAAFETLGGVIFCLLSFLNEKISFFEVDPLFVTPSVPIAFLLPV